MNEYKVSERKACRAISVERSSIRYRKRPDKNIELKKRMIHWSEKRPRYGHPRIHEMILRDGFKLNHKRTERLYFKELKLALNGKKKKRRYRSEARVPIPFLEAPNKVWSMDFGFEGTPDFITVDNGPEFICMALDKWAFSKRIKLTSVALENQLITLTLNLLMENFEVSF